MATNFEHRALVEQLRNLSQKRAGAAGDPGTSHPVGKADGKTQPAVSGARYDENTEDVKEMYPKGPEGSKAISAGSQSKDPGNSHGVKARPVGELPEVERKYNLGDHNDPGSSHPSAKAAALMEDARSIAAEIRNLIKASAEGDSYVAGGVPAKAKDKKPENAAGTGSYPADDENDGNIELSEDEGKYAAQKLAQARAMATADLVATRDSMKESAARDAESFVRTVTEVMDKFAAPHVLPAIQAQKQAAAAAELDETITKIALFDFLAERDGTPKFAEMCGAGGSMPPALPKAKKKDEDKKPDADGDGVPDWADSDEKAAAIRLITKLAAENEALKKKEVAARKGGTFRKAAEDSVDEDPAEDEEADESAESPEEVSQDEEQAAEQVLADMAAMPEGGEAPDQGAPMPEGEPALAPEEEAALMALLQQEGLGESDVQSYAKVSSLIANGKIDTRKLSAAQVAFLQTCDSAVKRAGAKFQTLRSASRLRNELNFIHKGIQS